MPTWMSMPTALTTMDAMSAICRPMVRSEAASLAAALTESSRTLPAFSISILSLVSEIFLVYRDRSTPCQM